MSPLAFYPADYYEAADRFQRGLSANHWQLHEIAVAATGPRSTPLAIQCAVSAPANSSAPTLILSTGLHGIEGYFGTAVLLQFLKTYPRQALDPVRIVLLHSLNPYGYSWLRRTDESNRDLNRNFLLPNEEYSGAPLHYAKLNRLLNPQHIPHSDLFEIRLALQAGRYGFQTVRNALVCGQYEFPQGLFYGGKDPSCLQAALRSQLPRWIRDSRRVVHLDFHTGLGKWSQYKLLIENRLLSDQRDFLNRFIGREHYVELGQSKGAAHEHTNYQARGSLGRWCHALTDRPPNYLFAVAEFGTYSPLKVLRALRAENAAFHWAIDQATLQGPTRNRLKEMFCPQSAQWRNDAMRGAAQLIERSLAGLRTISV